MKQMAEEYCPICEEIHELVEVQRGEQSTYTWVVYKCPDTGEEFETHFPKSKEAK